ncbi:MAG: hypothetical protein F6J87_02255 [Spirulina sp. SIO3F2]|nr:hypothetical protein [Spirulina sp. SIO3F2]
MSPTDMTDTFITLIKFMGLFSCVYLGTVLASRLPLWIPAAICAAAWFLSQAAGGVIADASDYITVGTLIGTVFVGIPRRVFKLGA